ncbi:MAG: SIR2 family protein [Tissierellales bacterium]|jgi:hypothetical protein|nr:SIR2 family protein [Tissierellales bacterium]
MDINSFIKNYNNHPVLFIGAGFSLRYLSNTYTWDSLLKYISYELTQNEENFLDLKSNSQNHDGSYSYEKIASALEQKFNDHLSLPKNRDGRFKSINDEFYRKMKEEEINTSRFKIYIASLFKTLNFKENMKEEVVALKKVRKNIGSIITTNYDELIENIFEFNPLIGNNILLSNPYGSIYKIHGCVTEPDKIIITEKDYNLFDEKYELIKAQLLSLFIHNPIIFIGYKVGDENIQKLLKTIFTYVPPNSSIAEKIKSNFLLVEYDAGSSNVEVHDHDIILDGISTIRVNKIKTDNFTELYNSIASLQLPVSAMDVRKVQTIVKDIYEGGSIQVHITNDIDKLKNDQKILAIGNINSITYDYQTSGEMMENYFKIIEEDNVQLLKLIEKHRIQKGQFFPIYAFSKINPTISTKERLMKQQKTKLLNIKDTMHKNCMCSHKTISDIESDTSIAPTKKPNAIIHCILADSLELLDVENYLRSYIDKQSTQYRRILCAYDFMKYSDDKSLISS